jgi:hypothetical protein
MPITNLAKTPLLWSNMGLRVGETMKETKVPPWLLGKRAAGRFAACVLPISRMSSASLLLRMAKRGDLRPLGGTQKLGEARVLGISRGTTATLAKR